MRNTVCVVVGDAMMDVTARVATPIEFGSDTSAWVSIQPGGSAASTACWLGHLGTTTAFVGCVGNDDFGRQIRGSFVDAGVQPRLALSTSRPTGTCVIVVDADGERTMFPDKGANDELQAALAELPALTADHHVHLSGYSLLNASTRSAALSILDRANAAGSAVSIDASSAAPLREHRQVILEALARVDVLLANEDEASILADAGNAHDAADRLADLVATAVVKRGGRGVVAKDASGTVVQHAPPASVVDSTGAGDAFAGGFLDRWLAGGSLTEAVSAGQRVAALAVSRVGPGRPPRPARD